MSYRVDYGDVVAVASRDAHLDERVRSERFSSEHEALQRARELLEQDAGTAVAIHDSAGNRLSGLRLQLKLGDCCE
jgi:Arc/MetJ-type ribon-helix-helix transcriptional regulator